MKYLIIILFLIGLSGFVDSVDAITPVTPSEISHAVDTTWTDIDVTAQLGGDAGSVAGVILQIVNNDGSTENDWGVRKNGSGDTIVGDMEDTGQTWVAIGIDGSDVFEVYLQDASGMQIYIVGYILESEGTFLTNSVNHNNTNVNAWEDWDISGDTTGGDVASVAFILMHNDDVSSQLCGSSLRENSSTDNRTGGGDFMHVAELIGGEMSVDGNEILETYINTAGHGCDSVDDVEFYLVGWLIDNFTSFANAKSYPAAGAGSYEDVNFSSDIPATNDGAFWHFFPASQAEYKRAITKKGTTGSYDIYFDGSYQYGWVEIDGNRIAEQKVESANLDLFLWGYTNTDAGVPPVAEEDELGGFILMLDE